MRIQTRRLLMTERSLIRGLRESWDLQVALESLMEAALPLLPLRTVASLAAAVHVLQI